MTVEVLRYTLMIGLAAAILWIGVSAVFNPNSNSAFLFAEGDLCIHSSSK